MPDVGLLDVLLLVGAGLVAGALNAAAGGGSLVSFPALLFVGYPPVLANVTNNVAVWPGYVSGAWGYREEMAGQRGKVWTLAVVPFLVLVACALIAFEPLLKRARKGAGTDPVLVRAPWRATRRRPSTAATSAPPSAWRCSPCWGCTSTTPCSA